MTHVNVILFKASGKYYTKETWRIPTCEEVLAAGGNAGDSTIPYCMKFSPDFRTVGGAVLVETQEPWGYPHLFPEPPVAARRPGQRTSQGAEHRRTA